MAGGGYIKLYRKMLDWEWYADPSTKCVFLHLLLLAQYKPCRYRGIRLEAGQVVISIREISEQTGVSVRAVRTAIERLKTTQEVTQETTQAGGLKFSVFTIKNYAKFQDATQETTQQATNDRHTNDTSTILRKKRSKEERRSSTRACAREDAPDGAPPLPPSPEEFFVENGFGKPGGYLFGELERWRAAGCADDLLLRAMQEALDAGCPRWSYARAVLERCSRSGIADAAAFDEGKRSRPSGGGRNAPVTRAQPGGSDLLAGAADRPRRLKRKE